MALTAATYALGGPAQGVAPGAQILAIPVFSSNCEPVNCTEIGVWDSDSLAALNHVLQQHARIQGGMGAGVSSWRLAKAVARMGQLGVVAGRALDQLLSRRLQLVQGRAGHDTPLPHAGHGLGQPPVGNSGAHAALDDRRDG